MPPSLSHSLFRKRPWKRWANTSEMASLDMEMMMWEWERGVGQTSSMASDVCMDKGMYKTQTPRWGKVRNGHSPCFHSCSSFANKCTTFQSRVCKCTYQKSEGLLKEWMSGPWKFHVWKSPLLPCWQSCWMCARLFSHQHSAQRVDIPAAQILSWHHNTSRSEHLPWLEVRSRYNYHNCPLVFGFCFCCSGSSGSLAFTHAPLIRLTLNG